MKLSYFLGSILLLSLLSVGCSDKSLQFTHKAPVYTSDPAQFEKHSQHHTGRSMDQDGYRVRYRAY